MEEYEEIRKKKIEEAKKKKEENSTWGKFKGFFHKDDEKREQHESQVYKVKKENSISFDISTGEFNTEMIPPEWQQIFDSLNISSDDLKDKEVVNIIVEETILQRAKKHAEENTDENLQKIVTEAEN